MMTTLQTTINIQICRLCLGHTSICYSLIDNENIAKMLYSLTSLQIQITDEISTVVCYKCTLNLKLAFKIQQNMLEASKLFHERFKQEIHEEIVVVKEEIHLDTEVKPIHECEVCHQQFTSRRQYRQHKVTHKRSTCKICHKEMASSSMFRHMWLHGDKKMCELCGAILNTVDNLRYHMNTAHQEAQHKCDFCDKIFKHKRGKINHEIREHAKGGRNLVCEQCGMKFFDKAYLNKHINMKHLKLKLYKCEFCKKDYSSKHALKTHERIHTNETPYRCDVCAEGFRNKLSLKTHLKSKHGIIEEITCHCGVCGRGFASKVALYAHERVHI